MPDPVADASGATALLALWNGVLPALEAEYEDWHAREHVPERLTVPGLLWGRRYRRIDAATADDPVPRYLTLYGLRTAAVLDSAPYQRLLREPTPASQRMRPALTQLSRWVCTLHQPGDLDAGDMLAVWTADIAPGPARSAPGCLLARRLPDAAPLPWLQGGQSHALRGDWLVAHATRPDAVVLPGSRRYRALPVG